jgi:hypothetical protein
MKRWLSFLVLLFFASFASAQVSVSTSYNYTLHQGAFKRNVPGAQLRVLYLYDDEKGYYFSYTHDIPITEGSMFDAIGDNEHLTVNSKIRYKFKTFNLGLYGTLAGSHETKGSLIVLMGLDYTVADYDEIATESYDQGRYPFTSEQSKGRADGVFGTLALGGSYKLGLLAFFGEAGYAYPVASSNDEFSATDLPPHIVFNTGVKIKLAR